MNWTRSSIILMRHGEPLASDTPQEQAIFRGTTDHVLSEKGWQQMHRAIRDITPLDNILCSPLRRCSEFAMQLAQQRNLPLQQHDELKEIHFGLWEGQLVEQVAIQFAPQLKKFWLNPIENTPPDGEPLLEFQHRVVEFWDKFLVTNKAQNSLIITHGGVQKIILAKVLDMPVQAVHNIEVPYACCSEINVYYSDDHMSTTLKSHGVRD